MKVLGDKMMKVMVGLSFIVLFLDLFLLIFFLFIHFDFLKCVAICFSIFACIRLNRALQGV